MRHLWCLRLSWCSRPQRGRWGLRLGRILHIDAHVGHAFHSLDGLPDIAHEHGVVGGVEQQGETHASIGGSGDIANEFGGDFASIGAVIR